MTPAQAHVQAIAAREARRKELEEEISSLYLQTPALTVEMAGRDDAITLTVSDQGQLWLQGDLRRNNILSPEEAIKVARWILATFAEESP